MSEKIVKQFKIKADAMRIIYKEYDSYKKEEFKQRERIAKLENSSDKCENEIKK